MARIIIDIPDSYVDWARWAQDELAKGGLPSQETTQGAAPSQSPTGSANGAPSDSTGPGNGQSDVPPTNDPWAAASATSAGTQATGGARAASSPSTSNRITKPTKNGDLVFELNLNNAPDCNCGDPAARLTAPKRAGGTYTKWVCAKDSGSDWKQKCDFSEWGS